MKYPNGKKVDKTVKFKNTANRGMSLEDDINTSNRYYLDYDFAVIHKKPTPITLVHVDYAERSKTKITEAYFKEPSTTDYNGIYKGKYIDFEAKESHSKTSFPFTSIHIHQINHLKAVSRHGAIAFIIIRFTALNTDYLIKADDFISFYETTDRRSLPVSWIKDNGYEIISNYMCPCDYIKLIDKVFD